MAHRAREECCAIEQFMFSFFTRQMIVAIESFICNISTRQMIVAMDHSVVSLCNDLSIPRNNCPNGDVTCVQRLLRQFNRNSHHVHVKHVIALFMSQQLGELRTFCE
jgi:hypothetical protein